jgi:hypothetical protein
MTDEEVLLINQIKILTEIRRWYSMDATKFGAFSRAITLMNDELAKKRRKPGTNVPEQKNVPPMPEFLKKNPPLGCSQVYVVAADRIAELAEAIQGQAEREAPDFGKIKAWSAEIGAQIRLTEEVGE